MEWCGSSSVEIICGNVLSLSTLCKSHLCQNSSSHGRLCQSKLFIYSYVIGIWPPRAALVLDYRFYWKRSSLLSIRLLPEFPLFYLAFLIENGKPKVRKQDSSNIIQSLFLSHSLKNYEKAQSSLTYVFLIALDTSIFNITTITSGKGLYLTSDRKLIGISSRPYSVVNGSVADVWAISSFNARLELYQHDPQKCYIAL